MDILSGTIDAITVYKPESGWTVARLEDKSAPCGDDSVIDTQTRDNFSTRLCFHTSPTSYRTVLGQSVVDVTQKGRAWAQITGQTLQQIQCPYVTRDEVQVVLTTDGPRRVLDLEATLAQPGNPKEQQIAAALADDPTLSDSKIAAQVFGYTNARTVEQVKTVRRRRQTL